MLASFNVYLSFVNFHLCGLSFVNYWNCRQDDMGRGRQWSSPDHGKVTRVVMVEPDVKYFRPASSPHCCLLSGCILLWLGWWAALPPSAALLGTRRQCGSGLLHFHLMMCTSGSSLGSGVTVRLCYSFLWHKRCTEAVCTMAIFRKEILMQKDHSLLLFILQWM